MNEITSETEQMKNINDEWEPKILAFFMQLVFLCWSRSSRSE